MFTHARYVIVDDNADELRQLHNALQSMGAPCLALRYDEVEGIAPGHLKGVRLLFLDLHLTTGAQTSDTRQAAAVIISMLEAEIAPTSGPYVIILWTKHAEQKGAFEEYVWAHLDPEKRPIAILSLDKNEYLAVGTGAKLVEDVARTVEADPQLRALLYWEREVLRAAGATLAEVATLVAADDKRAPNFARRLDEVLSLLAREATGWKLAGEDPCAAINGVLLPILSDRISHQRTDPESSDLWKAAITRTADAHQPDLQAAAKLNTLLHVALPHGEQMSSLTWGALTMLEGDVADAVAKRLDTDTNGLLSGAFCVVEKQDRRDSRLMVMRIGASCDYAQGKKGPIPFILGALIPISAPRRTDKLTKAEIMTPPVLVPGFPHPVILAFNAFLVTTLTKEETADWRPTCRLREQLLLQITTHTASYSSRPAVISFRS